ncbi:unnamed protein product [Trichogramma brassicae]|uniref:Uncharacterized protein n=1 Tax=Trichogramma brassicae TaxID=86971 RepID=A0A6H5IUI6_9HYME|nr:unnamed protein product [Trichogramma brassicae]
MEMDIIFLRGIQKVHRRDEGQGAQSRWEKIAGAKRRSAQPTVSPMLPLLLPMRRRWLLLLASLRENVNWEVEEERRKFIHQVYPSIERWDQYRLDGTAGPAPNIQDVFRSEEIDYLVMDYIKEYIKPVHKFIFFLAYSGYKDEPKLDEDGKPSSRRTTPVHHATKQNRYIMTDTISQIFKIYNRYDVNYTDESGLSHFHVACMYGFDDEIKKFLEFGQDPNCLWTETGDTPLHLYLIDKYYMYNTEMAEVLLRKSTDLNLANKDGLTPLHLISKICYYDMTRNLSITDVAKFLFEIADEKRQTLQIDARDKFGNTPLHLAALHYNDYVTILLLKRSADPNSVNEEESTPLHEFYKRDTYLYDVKGSVELFFRICDELNHMIQVDARDKLGRTPLQLAVANLWPDCIDILFERGTDLSNFIFPTESYFAERYKSSLFPINKFDNCWLRLASGALAVVEKIENRGYQLARSDALAIIKFFDEYKLFEKSTDVGKSWYDDEKFIRIAKDIRIRPGISHVQSYLYDEEWTYKTGKEIRGSPSLSLDEVVRLQPEEAAKLLTYEDYWKFDCSRLLCRQSRKYQELSALNLCEKLSRGFFQSWALDPFWELIHYRLPLEVCEMIIEHLSNEDLCNICLAAAGKSS